MAVAIQRHANSLKEFCIFYFNLFAFAEPAGKKNTFTPHVNLGIWLFINQNEIIWGETGTKYKPAKLLALNLSYLVKLS